MTWFYATSVTVANGQTVVAVNSGDDIQLAQSAGGLIIGTQPAVEIKRTFLDGSNNKKIELSKPWPYGTQTNQPAMAFPTDGDLAAATAVLKQLIDGFTLATQAEAQAGTENTKPMTALRVKQAMDALLGSAAKLTATVAINDATSGRALRVGDFGIAGGSVPTPDLDALGGAAGIYRQEQPTSGIAYSATLHMSSGDGRQQLTIDRQGGRLAFRGSPSMTPNSDGWWPWREVYHTGNILGQVRSPLGDSSGASAIIERGENANGEYVKFADGTMICRFTTAPIYGTVTNDVANNLVYSSAIAWYFPAAFASTPSCFYTPGPSNFNSGPITWPTGVVKLGVASPTVLNDSQIYVTFSKVGGTLASVQCLAFGRWRA